MEKGIRTAIAALTLCVVCGLMVSGCDSAGKSEKAAEERHQLVGDDAASANYAETRANAAAAEASLAAEAAAKETTEAPD
jgi:hypothetical protein